MEKGEPMPGKCRPSLRGKTLANVMYSNLSQTDKDCIKAVFERYEERPKGRWEKSVEGYKICNHCKADVAIFSGHKNFCPNCGADMRGDSDDRQEA
jgi:predicted RNA-binding Zn-ribbon protein involved in translation (DUF1610 family)